MLFEKDRHRVRIKSKYSYLSAVLHQDSKSSILELMSELNLSEEQIINDIELYLHENGVNDFRLQPYNQSYQHETTNQFVKLMLLRETITNRIMKKELSSIIHLNEAHVIQLNPLRFNKYADYIQRGNKKSLISNISAISDINTDNQIINDANLVLEKLVVFKTKESEEIILRSDTNFDSRFIEEIFTTIRHNKKQLRKLNDYDELVAKTINKYCKKNNSNPSLAMHFYNEYIARRLGSTGLFSDLGEDVNQLLVQMKKHQGTIYFPIISLKEKDAYLVGLKTETDWRIKAREYIKIFANSINLDESDVQWVCAYHEKKR